MEPQVSIKQAFTVSSKRATNYPFIFDCLLTLLRAEPSWASINRGVVVCNECCSVHRSLGRHISYIRSLHSTDWPPVLKEVGGCGSVCICGVCVCVCVCSVGGHCELIVYILTVVHKARCHTSFNYTFYITLFESTCTGKGLRLGFP